MRPRVFYGWVIVAVVFVTMAVGVNARTAFSLLFPPILDEFGWERGVTAGAFSFGFLVSAVLSPSLGRLMDRRGPRVVMEMGVSLMAAGLLLAPLAREPWHLYATLGVLVGGGSVVLGYTGQALFLHNWFVRRRGLAMSVAFSGVGVGSIVLLPWLQTLIGASGWRAACWAMAILVLVLLAPLNLLLRRRPEELGLHPDGDSSSRNGPATSQHADGAAALPHGRFAGHAGLRSHLRRRRHPGGDLPGAALRHDLWHADAVLHRRRGHRPLGDRRAPRRHRKLHAGLLDRRRLQRGLRGHDLARGPPPGTGRRGTRGPVEALTAMLRPA